MFWRLVLASQEEMKAAGSVGTFGVLRNAASVLRLPEGMSFSGHEADRLFVQITPDRPWVDVASIAGANLKGDGRTAVAADLDGDGDLDLIVRSIQRPKLTLLRNDGPSGGSVEVRVAGRAMGVGATVTLEAGGRAQVRPVVLGNGYLAQGPRSLHFGLGVFGVATRVSVRFPSGTTRSAENVPVGSIVEIREDAAEATVRKRAAPSAPLGRSVAASRSPAPLDLARLSQGLTPASRQALEPLLARGPQAKPVVVNFWASWCKPCRSELPELSKWAAGHPEVAVVAIAVDGTEAEAKRAARAFGARLEVGILAPGAADSLSIASAVPTTILFGGDGALRRGWVGPIDLRALTR